MTLLLDTHTLLWAMLGDSRLSRPAQTAIENATNEVFISVVCIWEIATKVRTGKMEEPGNLLQDPRRSLQQQGFRDLSLTLGHARLGGLLAGAHRDPFDRMLAAQALLENLTLVSADTALDDFGVTRLW
jgi:PIN domain nuclease of toxin-antitoxin system